MWLIKRSSNPTVVRKQILKYGAFSRDTLLDRVKEVKNNYRLVVALTYHSSITNLQNVFNEVHILLTPNKEHRKLFGDNPPMIGWRKSKSLKDHLVSAKIKSESSSVSPLIALDDKFVLLLRKLIFCKPRIRVERLTLEKGF